MVGDVVICRAADGDAALSSFFEVTRRWFTGVGSLSSLGSTRTFIKIIKSPPGQSFSSHYYIYVGVCAFLRQSLNQPSDDPVGHDDDVGVLIAINKDQSQEERPKSNGSIGQSNTSFP